MQRLILSLALLLALGVGATGALAGTSGGVVEEPGVLTRCPVIPQPELQELRGSYAEAYIFGLDITVDMASKILPTVAVNFNGIVPAGSDPPKINNTQVVLNPDGSFSSSPLITGKSLEVSYNTLNNDPVAYKVCVGQTGSFSGISQLVQVKSDNNLLLANTDLTIVLPKNMMPLNRLNLVPCLRPSPFLGTHF